MARSTEVVMADAVSGIHVTAYDLREQLLSVTEVPEGLEGGVFWKEGWENE